MPIQNAENCRCFKKYLKEIYDYDPYKSRIWQDEFEFVGTDSFSGERFSFRFKIKKKCLMNQYVEFINFSVLLYILFFFF